MNSSTAYNHYTRLSSSIRDTHSTTRIMCRDHKDHVAAISEGVWNDPAFKKLPRHYQAALTEIDSVMFRDIQLHWVAWMFINRNGKQVFYEELDEEDRIRYAMPHMSGDHYWLKLDHQHGKTIQYNSNEMTAVRKYKITNKKW